jgi:hypothetical protein
MVKNNKKHYNNKEFLINPDFQEFIGILNKHKVEYCITGAYAVSFHAEPRYTHDMDVYISNKIDNAKRVADAVKEFFGTGIDEKLFEGDKVIVRMGIEPNQIELSNHLSGLSDKEIISHRVKDNYGDTNTYYIGINELIKNKRLVKDMPHRGRKGLQDKKDYLTLLEVKAGGYKK